MNWKNICSLIAVLATGVVSADQMSGGQATVKKDKNMPMNQMDRGHEVCADQMGSGYNQYAEYDLGSNWDWFIQASFIYWHVSQEHMDIALTTQRSAGGVSSGTPNPGHLDFQEFKYKPGFKVAIGFDSQFDNWVPFAEYTWLHHETRTNKSVGSGHALNLGDWVSTPNNSTASRLSAKWKFDLDILDVAISRPYYQGTRLTVNPIVGLRGMWMKQTNRFHFSPLGSPGNPAATNPANAHYENKSWAVGPRVGAYTNWHLGAGFRAIGNAFASILYTRYNKVKMHVDQLDSVTGGTPTTSPINVKTGRISALRPQAEMNLGLGWGTYFFDHDYHIDFSATYDFMVFWHQNINRSLAVRTQGQGGVFLEPGDLYIHGLTVNCRFDF